jgi:hypothetical protein
MNDPEVFSANGFSLCKGGLTFDLMLKLHVGHRHRSHLLRRIVLFILVTWVPMAVLARIQDLGPAVAGPISFFSDLSIYARFFVTFPLFIAAEVSIDPWIGRMVAQFVETGLVRPDVLPGLRAALNDTARLRDSWWIEGMILVSVWMVNSVIRREEFTEHLASWASFVTETGRQLTLAGMWYTYVSAPLFLFLAARWVWRIGLWTYLLRRISTLDLRLAPAHPDRVGGLGFLAVGQTRFAILSFATGTVAASHLANLVVFEHVSALSFRTLLIATVVVQLALVLAPLLVFTPRLFDLREKAKLQYGALATRYVRDFDAKWLRGQRVVPEQELLGNDDIQALADLDSSFKVVQEIRVVPFGKETVLTIVFAYALPLLPLFASELPLKEILSVMGKMLV